MSSSAESLFDKEKINLENLRNNFCGIFDVAKKDEAAELFKKIVEKYQSEKRAYHNIEHVENFLSFLEKFKQRIRDEKGVKLAAWLHDVIYDTEAKDNEERSAKLAQDYLGQLGVSGEVMEHVTALIRATAKHEAIEGDSDSEIFLDADLAILGSSEEEYDKYAAKIRREYSWVPDDQYRAGRKDVLESFLIRPKIYFTEEAEKELEGSARKNIEREIKILS